MAPQIVLMTGSSSGIGLATAVRLAQDPDRRFIVIATVIALADKDDLVAAIGGALDKNVFIKVLDITQEDDIASVVDDVIKTYGRIDTLLNIAGVNVGNVPERVSRKEIDCLFGVNLIGPIRLTQAVLPHMKQKRAGKIITISSVAGRIGHPYTECYAASKFGIEGFYESLAASVRAFNIRVCLIEPGGVTTDMVSKLIKSLKENNTNDLDAIDRRQLSGLADAIEAIDLLKPDDIVDAIVGRCLDVDEPDFRHLICREDMKEAISKAVVDFTGESAVAIVRKNNRFT